MFDKGWTGLFKQATEMQSKLAEIQEGLAEKTIEVSTGGGMVKVVANGLNEIISIKIDDELINMKDREVLEDLITGAVNEASKKVKELAQGEMTKSDRGYKNSRLIPPDLRNVTSQISKIFFNTFKYTVR